MRHLLTHTGGWVGDYFDDFGAGDDALARMCDSMSILTQLTPLGKFGRTTTPGSTSQRSPWRGALPSPPKPSPPPATVSVYQPDRLFVTEGPPGEMDFVRAPDGSIAWFRVGGRIMARTEA